jgi:hypothetical protein
MQTEVGIKVSRKFLDDREEQARIKDAVWDAIPVNVTYENIIKALLEVQKEAVYKMFEAK